MDSLIYRVTADDLSSTPASVRIQLYLQATPPSSTCSIVSARPRAKTAIGSTSWPATQPRQHHRQGLEAAGRRYGRSRRRMIDLFDHSIQKQTNQFARALFV